MKRKELAIEYISNVINESEKTDIIVKIDNYLSKIENNYLIDVLLEFQDYFLEKRTESYAKTCFRTVRKYYMWLLDNDILIKDPYNGIRFIPLNENEINSYIDTLKDEKKTYQPTLYILKQFDQFLIRVYNTEAAFKENKKLSSRVTYRGELLVSDTDFKQIIELCYNSTEKLIIELAYTLMLKAGQISELKENDIDFAQSTIKIENNNESKIIKFDSTIKGLLMEQVAEMHKIISLSEEARRKKGRPVRENYGYLFQSLRSNTCSVKSLQGIMRFISARYTFEMDSVDYVVTLNSLRVSRMVYLLAQGKTRYEVMSMARTTNISSLLKAEEFVEKLYNKKTPN